MRRATRLAEIRLTVLSISIHALHEESDSTYVNVRNICMDISIHALHEESDL